MKTAVRRVRAHLWCRLLQSLLCELLLVVYVSQRNQRVKNSYPCAGRPILSAFSPLEGHADPKHGLILDAMGDVSPLTTTPREFFNKQARF
jgi:hypothetical protein